ncbi:MAG TPA: polysaccharide deacetylase family protein [Bryobacteraceae bacterium]|nr:polysaccharide deacetylase family protein [Bryobacteraceae bacterium]
MNGARSRALAGLSLSAAAMAWGVRGRSSQIFGPSTWRARPGRKALALTFDDGPSPATGRILDILESYGAPATFFQCGRNVLRAPELSRAVCAGPHEIGNHSHTHPNFALRSPAFIEEEFRRAQDAIAETTSNAPVFLRPPFGVRWFGFREMQKRLGLTCIMWSVIGLDWKLSAPRIAERILSRARDGSIICLHDGRGTLERPDASHTIEAVRRIVPALLEKGYHFETVSRILCRN